MYKILEILYSHVTIYEKTNVSVGDAVNGSWEKYTSSENNFTQGKIQKLLHVKKASNQV